MAAHKPAKELVPKPGHSGQPLVPIGMASGIPRMSTSTMSSTIQSFSAADRSMARFMLALTPSVIYLETPHCSSWAKLAPGLDGYAPQVREFGPATSLLPR